MPEFDLDAALVAPPSSVRYKVEMDFLGGWDDAGWTEWNPGADLPRPMLFLSKEDAYREIRAHCRDCREAVARGDMDEADHLEDFRVVEVEKGTDNPYA